MNIGIITPAPPGSRLGNRVTAIRWARILRSLGHRVTITEAYGDQRFDLLVALHARRSFDSVSHFHREHPDTPIVVALTGTDLYRDLRVRPRAKRSLEIATRIVVLQKEALEDLRRSWRTKARVIHQSVSVHHPVRGSGTRPQALGEHPQASKMGSFRGGKTLGSPKSFDVCVVGHLRPVKDPFRAAMAVRRLPISSRIRVVHAGGALTAGQEARAIREMKTNTRYKWLGEVSRPAVERLMSRSRLFVISSVMEGGANALGEAIVSGLPVLASRIPGTVGILGERYPGYFEVGDTVQLARLMLRGESDPRFLADLARYCGSLISLFDPASELQAWSELLDEIFHERRRFDTKHHGGRGWRR